MVILRSYSATTAQLGLQAQRRFDEAGGAIAVDSADGLNGASNGSFVAIQSASGGGFAVDPEGAGKGFTPVAELAGISGPNPNQLVADGNLELT